MLPLTEQEQRVIAEQGTEPPFSGRFLQLTDPGTYCCRRCQTPLFASEHKFDAGCGWPAFDDELPHAIRRLPDSDGRRTEIRCNACDAHLGHVFVGEGLTPTDLRHCVNALSLSFTPSPLAEHEQIAMFGGGCFWCLEALFQQVKGVKTVKSGYAGGTAETADYAQVCRGDTGHIEVVWLTFDASVISFGQLLELFFDCHDPTSWDQQGADQGSQYRSVIFCQHDEQRRTAQVQIQNLERYRNGKIVTELLKAQTFYVAEPEHQNYFQRFSEQPYCAWNIQPKLARLAVKYSDRLRLDNK